MLPKDHNPFAHRDELKKMEKLRASEKALQDKIQAVLDGDQPSDAMSWEYYIWSKYKDPLKIKGRR